MKFVYPARFPIREPHSSKANARAIPATANIIEAFQLDGIFLAERSKVTHRRLGAQVAWNNDERIAGIR